jgi:hypothetical protein
MLNPFDFIPWQDMFIFFGMSMLLVILYYLIKYFSFILFSARKRCSECGAWGKKIEMTEGEHKLTHIGSGSWGYKDTYYIEYECVNGHRWNERVVTHN